MDKFTHFKVDIYSLNELEAPSSSRKYFGTIPGYTDRGQQCLTNLLQYDGTKGLIEGVEIKSYAFDNVILYDVTGLLFDGQLFKNALYNSKDIIITNKLLDETSFSTDEDINYVMIGDGSTKDIIKEGDFGFLKRYSLRLVRRQIIFEWGTSAFWEGFVLNVSSGLIAELLKKLERIGLPKTAIKTFKLPPALVKELAKVYNINAKSLFIESYQKRGQVEKMALRGINQRFYIGLKLGALNDFRVEALTSFL